jgi:hypothetical protein
LKNKEEEKKKKKKKKTTTVIVAAAIAVAALILLPLVLLTTTTMTTTVPAAAAAQIISSPIQPSSPNSESVVGPRVFTDLQNYQYATGLSDNNRNQSQNNTVVNQIDKNRPGGS